MKRRAEAELRTHTTVTQIKQTSGLDSEIEWIKTDLANDGSAPADAKSAQALKMNGSEWQDSIAKLAAQFGSTKRGRAGDLSLLAVAEGAPALERQRLRLIYSEGRATTNQSDYRCDSAN